MDDFFRLGGNSILAIKLTNRLNKTLNTTVNVSALFTCRNIRKLAEHLHNAGTDGVRITAIQVQQPEEQLLSFAQERLWFIENYEGGSHAYNIPVVMKLQQDVLPEIILQALLAIVHRHEVLRSRICTSNSGNGFQQVIDDAIQPLHINRQEFNNIHELETALENIAGYVFSLQEEYPIRVNLFSIHTTDQSTTYYLAILLHHIAFDGWSTSILLKELQH